MKSAVYALVMMLLLSFVTTGAWAVSEPMTPEVAAKAARSKQMMADRITPSKRKAAAEALKQQKQRVIQAREKSGSHQHSGHAEKDGGSK